MIAEHGKQTTRFLPDSFLEADVHSSSLRVSSPGWLLSCDTTFPARRLSVRQYLTLLSLKNLKLTEGAAPRTCQKPFDRRSKRHKCRLNPFFLVIQCSVTFQINTSIPIFLPFVFDCRSSCFYCTSGVVPFDISLSYQKYQSITYKYITPVTIPASRKYKRGRIPSSRHSP